MTAQIDLTTASELFEDQVTTKFQNAQKLAGTIEERHGTTGVATNVPVSDIVEMEDQSFAPADIPITPINPTNVMVVPYNYALKTVIGGGEKTLFSYDMIVSHARLHALAAGRMVDYIKIEALYGSSLFGSLYTVQSTVGVSTGLNEGKMAAGLGYLENQSVDITNNQVSMWMPAITKPSLLNDEKVVNIFYNDKKPLVNYMVPNYLGVDIRTLGANGINTIPYTTAGSPAIDTYLVPMVHHDSMLQTFNRDVTTSIHWMGNNDRWELLTVLTSGCEIIQPNGIVLLEVENPYTLNSASIAA